MKKLFHLGAVIVLLALLFLNPDAAHAAGTTITVNTTEGTNTNDGNCSLPEAVLAVNTSSTVDTCTTGSAPYTIAFSIGSGAQTITLSSGLGIDEPVLIDGTTQSGYSGTPLIRVDGNNSVGYGLIISSGSEGSIVKGLMVTGFTSEQVSIYAGNSTSHVTLLGNYIGTDGTNGLSPSYAVGLDLYGGQYNQIGGPAASDRNVISGNTENLELAYGADHNTIQGNYIGLNASGTAAVSGNSAGMLISQAGGLGANDNQIIGNVISGNSSEGIYIASQYNNNNVIQSNYIGTDASGTSAIANVDGIDLSGGDNNQISGNVISGNTSSGIYVAGGPRPRPTRKSLAI